MQQKQKKAVDSYTHHLWKAIRKRLSKTDMTQSPCAFSEAPAEGIFSIMERVKQGRGSLSVKHLVQLSRLAAHGPPASTEAAMHLSKAALKNYKSQYGEFSAHNFGSLARHLKLCLNCRVKGGTGDNR